VREPWPQELTPVFERSVTCEFTSLDRAGRPVTWALTPYLGEERTTIDVSTGLAYPAKAERARRNPRVTMLFSDPAGTGLADPPVVLVQGIATIRDRDVQANADRYVALSMAKLPEAWEGSPRAMIRRQRWYFARSWMLVTPVRMWWWPDRSLAAPPQTWEAPEGTTPPPSDPPPEGPPPPPWQREPEDWRDRAVEAIGRIGLPVLTVIGPDGFACSFPAQGVRADPEGFELDLPPNLPVEVGGRACLTFHMHSDPFLGQENAVFVGEVEASGGQGRFRVERLLPDFSLPGGRVRRTMAFLGAGRRLSKRLRHECERRGQPVPRVNLPPR
jgi:hypothetical protein